ncbi:MAG: type II secretion system F family protein [Armatimonadetes bacterium]|nr:type II secretion system F family protein [Armatimonadota bacterium]
MPLLISILCAATVFLFILGMTRAGESAIRDERLGIGRQLDSSLWQRMVVPLWSRITDVVSRSVPSTALKNIELELDSAGLKLRPVNFVAYRIASAALFTISAIWICVAFKVQLSLWFVYVIGGVIVGLLLPKAVVSHLIADRRKKIVRMLPDAIDLLVVCVEAGLGLDAGMDQVVGRMSGPVAEEFKRTLDDIASGQRRMDALRNTSKRVGVSQLSMFVAALYQAEQLGASIAEVLEDQASGLRVQRNLRAREEAAKLPLKLLFPMALCIMPSLFVVVLLPGVLKLFKVLL